MNEESERDLRDKVIRLEAMVESLVAQVDTLKNNNIWLGRLVFAIVISAVLTYVVKTGTGGLP